MYETKCFKTWVEEFVLRTLSKIYELLSIRDLKSLFGYPLKGFPIFYIENKSKVGYCECVLAGFDRGKTP